MRIVIQRVSSASVTVDEEIRGSISRGMLVFVGIGENDGMDDVNWLANKIVQLRIFDDSSGIMNLSVKDIDGEVLLVSQFTLHALVKKGNRPSYVRAARPGHAIPLYEALRDTIEKALGKTVITGVFGAEMQVGLVNDGPVTILIDTKNRE